MDDIFHGYQCGEDCPTCHPEIQQVYLEHRRWRVWPQNLLVKEFPI